MKSWKAGRKLVKKLLVVMQERCCIIFEDTGLFQGKSIAEKVCLSTDFVN